MGVKNNKCPFLRICFFISAVYGDIFFFARDPSPRLGLRHPPRIIIIIVTAALLKKSKRQGGKPKKHWRLSEIETNHGLGLRLLYLWQILYALHGVYVIYSLDPGNLWKISGGLQAGWKKIFG